MTTMIELVARAMVAADSGPEGSALFDIHWHEFGAGYLKSARAAIEVMREPTEAMLTAGRSAFGTQYRDMIDYAINEKEPT